MRPDERELDEEIRGHLALSIKDRIDSGDDPDAARRAALMEFGYMPAIRDSMRRVWYTRWFDAGAALGQDMRVGLRSLLKAKGLAVTVVATLALGIGANAAIFSVIRQVLLRPLVNRDQDRLLYIRQRAPGLGVEKVLAPERLNALVLSGFGGVALLIAVVGVAGVLAFSVSARTREFGVRLAVGSSPRLILLGVLKEGAVIVAIGIVAGVAGGYALGRVVAGSFENVSLPGVLPLLGAAIVLIIAAIFASLMPASRASRVDVLQALRSE